MTKAPAVPKAPAATEALPTAKASATTKASAMTEAPPVAATPTGEHFRALIATAADGIIVIDQEGHVQIFNEAAERLFGYSVQEVVGKNVNMLMPSPYREKHDGYLSHHRLTGEKRIIGIGREVVGRRKDGSTFPLHLSVGDGTSGFYVGILHDLTERKRWEAVLIEREERLKSMLDASLGIEPMSLAPGSTISSDEQKQNERRLRLIAEVGEVLATTLDFEETLTHISQLVVGNMADLCVVNFVEADGVSRRARVYTRDPSKAWVCEALMRMPPGQHQINIMKSVMEIRKPALIADVTPELIRSWAGSSEQLVAFQTINPKSAIIVPLLVRGRLLGALSLISSDHSRTYTIADLRVAMAIADRSAFFLENARLYRDAKTTEHQLRLIGEVGERLATTLEFEDTLSNIAQLVIDNLADVCVIDSIDDDGIARRSRVLCRDSSKAWACDALMRMPPGERRIPIAQEVLETKKAILIPEVTQDLIRSWAISEEHLLAIQNIAPKSAMIVPILLHGKLLGALSLMSSDSSRQYGPADLRMAEAIAIRSAFFLQNTHLYREALQATKARDDVFRVVAHDLRNPLQIIQALANLLKRTGNEPKLASEFTNAVSRMNMLIQDLLDVSRLRSGNLQINAEEVDASQIASESLEAQSPLVSAASLEIGFEKDGDLPPILADRRRIRQVFENLIGNAIKFTKPGGHIDLKASRQPGEVLFSVADTGCGIPHDQLPHLFDIFWQAPGQDTIRGAGLGLPIVKGIVEAHGGHVWVESSPGKGTTFFFTVPTALEQGSA